jgi:hypothetical protein
MFIYKEWKFFNKTNCVPRAQAYRISGLRRFQFGNTCLGVGFTWSFGIFLLNNDCPKLDEECTDIAIVIASEVRKGTRVTWRTGNDEELCCPVSHVP